MNDLFAFNKAIAESMFDRLTGGKESLKNFPARQKVRKDTYLALLEFWNAILDCKGVELGDFESVTTVPEFSSARNTFEQKLRVIYNTFEPGKSMDDGGLVESLADKIGKIFHKNVFAGSESFQKEIEYEFEQFWFDFLKLKGVTKEVLTKDQRQQDYIDRSILAFGTGLVKDEIKSRVKGASGNNKNEDESASTADNLDLENLISQRDESLKQEQLHVTILESQKRASAITKNILPDLNKQISLILKKHLNKGVMLEYNRAFGIQLSEIFFVNRWLSKYTFLANFRLIFELLKATGSNDYDSIVNSKELQALYAFDFWSSENLTGKSNFIEKLVSDTDKAYKSLRDEDNFVSYDMFSGITSETAYSILNLRFTHDVYLFARIKVGLGLPEKGYEDLDIEEFSKLFSSSRERELNKLVKDVMDFWTALGEKRQNEVTEAILELKTPTENQLLRYWLNRDPRKNTSRHTSSPATLKRKISGSIFFVREMHPNLITYTSDIEKSDKLELREVMSDILLDPLVDTIIPEYVESFEETVRNTIFLELESRRKDFLYESVDHISTSLAQEIIKAMFYRIQLWSRQSHWHENAEGQKWDRNKEYSSSTHKRLVLALRLPVSKKIESIEGNLDAPDFEQAELKIKYTGLKDSFDIARYGDNQIAESEEEIVDVFTARNWMDNLLNNDYFIQLDRKEKHLIENVNKGIYAELKSYLHKTLKDQIEHFYPGSLSEGDFDPNVNYDLSTFEGVLSEFLRNVTYIFDKEISYK